MNDPGPWLERSILTHEPMCPYAHAAYCTEYLMGCERLPLRFAGSKTVEITVRDRNLLRICDYIHLHRMAWIRVADRDFADAGGVPDHQPIITGMMITEVVPPEAATRG